MHGNNTEIFSQLFIVSLWISPIIHLLQLPYIFILQWLNQTQIHAVSDDDYLLSVIRDIEDWQKDSKTLRTVDANKFLYSSTAADEIVKYIIHLNLMVIQILIYPQVQNPTCTYMPYSHE